MKRKLIWSFLVAATIGLLVGYVAEASEQGKKPTLTGAGGAVTLEVLNPRGEIPPIPVTGITPRVKDLDGKKIGLVDNTKAGAEYFLDTVEELLKTKFPSATIERFRKREGIVNPAPKMYSHGQTAGRSLRFRRR